MYLLSAFELYLKTASRYRRYISFCSWLVIGKKARTFQVKLKMLSQALKHTPQVPDASNMSFGRLPHVPCQVLYASSDHPMGT